MVSALIGYSGFVGTTLLKQERFDDLYRSTNIQDIKGKSYDRIVCCGAPAQKWIANKEPEADRENIQSLIDLVKTVSAKEFILISTVDVFKDPNNVDENTPIDTKDLHAYGLNRYHLEEEIKTHFEKVLIVRLPGLVGPGLRKNVIYDFLNDNNCEVIDSRSIFQFYPLVNLWYDIEIALENNLELVHLTAAPVSVSDVSSLGFTKPFENHLDRPPARYDFRSIYAEIFDGSGYYQSNIRESLQAIRAYAQSEPLTKKG